MGEHARREASYRTRRGLNGRALAGQSTGGRAFGYVSATDSPSGQIEIDSTQAAVVTRIFEMYADGHSPRAIAAQLNAEGIPSPGASWNRTVRRRDGKWLASAIHGDTKRGTGILNNRRYIGLITWGRSEWKRSAADSAVRRQRQLEAAAVERTDERLRIIPEDLWQRAKARQQQQSRQLGVRVKGGLRRVRHPFKYLLSGSLRCEACRASFALSNATRYQCSSHHEGGPDACAVSLSVPRDRIERIFIDYMAGPELPRRLAEIEARWASSAPVSIDHRPRIAHLEKQRANLIEAIKSGGLAPELGGELKQITAELEQLKLLAQARPTGRRAPRETVEQRVERIREKLATGGEVAQEVVRDLFPAGIWLYPDPNGGRHLWAYAMTAGPQLSGLVDVEGRALTDAFPRVYNAVAAENRKVGEIGSGGVIPARSLARMWITFAPKPRPGQRAGSPGECHPLWVADVN
jgi:site-specific DNA recombinase